MTAALLTLLLAADLSPAAKSWWHHVEVLADDNMEGRETGSKGQRMAAEYIAQEFERSGLKPGGTQGYYQPVPFKVRKIDEEHSSIELVRNGAAQKVQLGRDAVIGLRVDPAPKVEAPIVFAGYGFAVPEKLTSQEKSWMRVRPPGVTPPSRLRNFARTSVVKLPKVSRAACSCNACT